MWLMLSNTSHSMTSMEVLELLQNQTANRPLTVKTTNITRTDYWLINDATAAAVWLDLVTYEVSEVSPSPAVSVSVFVSMKPLDVRIFWVSLVTKLDFFKVMCRKKAKTWQLSSQRPLYETAAHRWCAWNHWIVKRDVERFSSCIFGDKIGYNWICHCKRPLFNTALHLWWAWNHWMSFRRRWENTFFTRCWDKTKTWQQLSQRPLFRTAFQHLQTWNH